MMATMWSKRNAPLYLLGVETHTAIMEISGAVTQEDGNQYPSRNNNTKLGHIRKGCFI